MENIVHKLTLKMINKLNFNLINKMQIKDRYKNFGIMKENIVLIHFWQLEYNVINSYNKEEQDLKDYM